MFQTFNPNSNKRISIYTNRQPVHSNNQIVDTNRNESPIGSNRSASPPISQKIITPIQNIEALSPQTYYQASRTGIESSKSSQIIINGNNGHRNDYDLEQTLDKRMSFAPNSNKTSFIHKISNMNTNLVNADENGINNNANVNMMDTNKMNTNPIPNVNPNSSNNTRMRMMQTKTHKRTHSLEQKIIQPKPSRFGIQANQPVNNVYYNNNNNNNVNNYEDGSSVDPTSFKVV